MVFLRFTATWPHPIDRPRRGKGYHGGRAAQQKRQRSVRDPLHQRGDSAHLASRYLDMPTLEELSIPVLKRKAPIKAVLLDQHGPLCGLGNWLVSDLTRWKTKSWTDGLGRSTRFCFKLPYIRLSEPIHSQPHSCWRCIHKSER